MNPPRTIGQGLALHWKQEKAKDTPRGGVIPLLPWLEYQYEHRYRALCLRVGTEPKSFANWLLTPIDSL